MAREAHIVGTLVRDEHGNHMLARISAYSEAAWGLTQTGNGAIKVQLMPPIQGESYGQAVDNAQKLAEQWFPRLHSLMDWRV